jgi:hypothetical protein
LAAKPPVWNISMTQTALISEWEISHNKLVRGMAEYILLQANRTEIPDVLTIKGEIFGIELTYERIVKRSALDDDIPNEAIEFRYAIYTKSWVVELCHDVHSVTALADLKWHGRGDYDRWMRDATLIRLYLE